MNAIPGIRMEQRSPGSFRLNIRGSSLRLPFGIRNVYEIQFKWSKKQTLDAFFHYTNLFYQPPGALTEEEFRKEPHFSGRTVFQYT